MAAPRIDLDVAAAPTVRPSLTAHVPRSGGESVAPVARRRSWWWTACAWGAGAVLAALTFEVVIALTLRRNPPPRADALFGFVPAEGWAVKADEGFSIDRINAEGFRGALTTPHGAHEYRLLVFGDSYAEGVHVPYGAVFSSQLARTLQQDGHDTVTVLNRARSGAGPADYITLAPALQQRYEPDLVIIALNEGDFSRQLQPGQTGLGHQMIVAGADSFRIIPASTGYEGALQAINELPWLQPLKQSMVLREGRRRVPALFSGTSLETSGEGAASSIAPATSVAAVEWTMPRLARAYPHLLLVFIPKVAYDGDPAAPTDIERAVERTAAREGIRLVNPRAAFVDAFRTTGQPAHGFFNSTPGTGHINGLGHRLTADAIARVLRRDELAPRGAP